MNDLVAIETRFKAFPPAHATPGLAGARLPRRPCARPKPRRWPTSSAKVLDLKRERPPPTRFSYIAEIRNCSLRVPHPSGRQQDSGRNSGRPEPARSTGGLDLAMRRAFISSSDPFAEEPLPATPDSLLQCSWQYRSRAPPLRLRSGGETFELALPSPGAV
jgi:hypothetical protein